LAKGSVLIVILAVVKTKVVVGGEKIYTPIIHVKTAKIKASHHASSSVFATQKYVFFWVGSQKKKVSDYFFF